MHRRQHAWPPVHVRRSVAARFAFALRRSFRLRSTDASDTAPARVTCAARKSGGRNADDRSAAPRRPQEAPEFTQNLFESSAGLQRRYSAIPILSPLMPGVVPWSRWTCCWPRRRPVCGCSAGGGTAGPARRTRMLSRTRAAGRAWSARCRTERLRIRCWRRTGPPWRDCRAAPVSCRCCRQRVALAFPSGQVERPRAAYAGINRSAGDDAAGARYPGHILTHRRGRLAASRFLRCR